MAKIKSIKNIIEISGFGKYTKYEKACQDMLQAGYVFLESCKEGNLKAKVYKNVYGIFTPTSKKAKLLGEAVTKSHPDCTGAMFQAVMQHLFFIGNNGVEKWEKEIKRYRKR
jgi:hypothetical protein